MLKDLNQYFGKFDTLIFSKTWKETSATHGLHRNSFHNNIDSINYCLEISF